MERVFLKLGGSLITRKKEPYRLRPEVLVRLAEEIRAAREERPGLRVLLGHGSGSFGHAEAARQGLDGSPSGDWQGYLRVRRAALRLHNQVLAALEEAGLPAAGFSPWGAAILRRREVAAWPLHALGSFLTRGGIPVVHGDVAWEEDGRTSIVSTEALFLYLARYLPPERVVLALDVEGLFTADPREHPEARPIPLVRGTQGVPAGAAGAPGGDATGGMAAKLEAMLALVRERPGVEVRLLSGEVEGAVQQALLGRGESGTRIVAA